MLSVIVSNPKGALSEIKAHARLYFEGLKAGRSTNGADSPRSPQAQDRKTIREVEKNSLEKRKKPERPRRRVRKIDEHVIAPLGPRGSTDDY